jgi:glycosyltransferase involved in cell wall biosynthesis
LRLTRATQVRILIIANDVVATQMAGPGIRCFELGRQLTLSGHAVTIAGISNTDISEPGITFLPPLSRRQMVTLAASQDAIMLEGLALARHGVLRRLDVPLIVDLYDPFPLALLEQESEQPMGEQVVRGDRVRQALKDLLTVGDFFICASERQRDLWVGSLMLAKRVDPAAWKADRTLRHLIDVVPFGVSSEPFPERTPGTRMSLGLALEDDDLVMVWGGGIYNWFDPLTLLRAVARVAPTLPRLKLVFMSTTHPHKGVPERMWMMARTRELSDRLGLTGVNVFFHEEWVGYKDRGIWLSAADCGVSTHFDHAETRYSFRTRILDYLWAGLPIICTEGDVLADVVHDQHLGWVVPPEDENCLVAAILALAEDPSARETIRANVRKAAAEATWSRASVNLLRFCENPYRTTSTSSRRRSGPVERAEATLGVLRTGLHSLRSDGFVVTGRKAAGWLIRR